MASTPPLQDHSTMYLEHIVIAYINYEITGPRNCVERSFDARYDQKITEAAVKENDCYQLINTPKLFIHIQLHMYSLVYNTCILMFTTVKSFA